MGYPQGIFERLDWLTKKYKQLCCLIQGGGSGCITHKDITWDELNAKNATGTLADCYYNVIDRPASGTDPLYVLAEGGRVDLDNEVVRQQPATGSLCVDSQQEGFGCFNIYAEATTYTVEYVPGVQVVQMRLEALGCPYTTGTTITETLTGATGTIVWTASSPCFIYVQVTSGTFSNSGVITDGSVETFFLLNDKCFDPSPLAVGTEVIGILSDPNILEPTGTITAISGSTITITPTSGNWNGLVVFVVNDKGGTCFYTLTAPIVGVSTQLNSETICWDADSYIGYNVILNTLMQASDSLLYGTLRSNYNAQAPGQLFSLDPITNTTTVLIDFIDGKEYGVSPQCGLVEIAGELYGTCARGGDYGNGTLWKWNIATKTFTKLHDFTDDFLNPLLKEGSVPTGTLLNKSGVLYGTCQYGGANDAGTVFSYNVGTSTFTKLADFGGILGLPSSPVGPLTEVNPGELWSTSETGGTSNKGTIFKYTISSGLIEEVIDLGTIINANAANGGVSLGSDGNVYFSTNGGVNGWGVICQITNVATSPALNVLYDITNTATEGIGFTNLCPIYIDGYLYGTTNAGGSISNGVLYKLNVATGFFTKLHDFGIADGGNLRFGILFPVGDELFAMSNPPKNKFNAGQIFKYNIVTDEYTNIHLLNSQAQTSADIATDICTSITNPLYTCHTVGNCVYIDGPAGENGYTLVLKTVVTYRWCRTIDPLDPTACDPTVGDTLFDNTNGQVIGTIQTVTITEVIPGEKVCGTLIVELADNNYFPQDIDYTINETGCVGHLFEVTGSTLSYVVTPFAGGTEPVNLPCYYNVPFDVITEYPLSQKLTRKEIEYLVANNLLIPGTYYRIIDADFFLYGGTEIVIQAVAPDKFADMGMGKFYVPRYNQEQAGYGIWNALTEETGGYSAGDTVIWGGLVWTYLENGPSASAPSAYNLFYGNWSIPGRVKITISGISGTFSVGDQVYGYDSGLLGLITEVGTDYLIVMAPPSFFAYPTWDPSNIIYDYDSGAEATMDSVELHTDYFSDLIYDVRWDEIKYDYANDFISYRKDNSGNSVNQERWEYDDYAAAVYRGILGMQWGNDFNDGAYIGVGDNTIFGNSYVEIINFQGATCLGNSFTDTAIYSNTFRPSFGSNFSGNIFNTTFFVNNLLDVNGSISRNNVNLGSIASNYVDGSISENIISYNGGISGVAIYSGNGVFTNTLFSSYIQSGTLGNGSVIRFNIFNNTTFIGNFNFNNSSLLYTTLNACTINFSASGILTNKNIQYLNGTNGQVSASLAGATIIYGNYAKDLINNAAGTPVLRYIDAGNTQVITAVTT